MGRILGIDYGRKRCGIAVTDIFQISINPLAVIPPETLLSFIQDYLKNEEVDQLVVGWPTHNDGNETYLVSEINTFLTTFAQLFPKIKITKVDESFSSSEARDIILNSGIKKKQRQDKSLVDKMSAVIIIKRFLEAI